MQIEVILGVIGVYFFYMLYGIAQEKLNFTEYFVNNGDDATGESVHWRFTLSTLTFQCLSNCFVGRVQIFLFDKVKAASAAATSQFSYFVIAAMYISAMFASNYALEYVDYPTQVLFKSCKIVPVIVMGVFYGHTYTLRKWICVFLITLGVAIFVLKDIPFFPIFTQKQHQNQNQHQHQHQHQHQQSHANGVDADDANDEWTYYIGISLLVLSLSMDGVYSNLQDTLKKTSSPSAGELMFWLNFWSVVLLLLIDIPFVGHIKSSYYFATEHPAVLIDLASFAICSALGQIFIFFLIVRCGSLFVATVTTTRKFFTILISVLYFQHPVNIVQWFGVICVFIGLALDDHQNASSRKEKDSKKDTKKD